MIVSVLEAGAGPGDFARVRLSTEPDGVNPPDVFELTVGLKPHPDQRVRTFSVDLKAGSALEFVAIEEGEMREGRLSLFRKEVDMTECVCTEADDPSDHRKDCPKWRQELRA